MRVIYFTLIVLTSSTHFTQFFAQQLVSVSGQVTDGQESAGLSGATVLLIDTAGVQSILHTYTDEIGDFELRGITAGVYKLNVSYIGYSSWSQLVVVQEDDVVVSPTLQANAVLLGGAIIRDTLPPVVYLDDTTRFNATLFYRKKQRKLIEMLRTMPGFTIESDGTMLFQGKPIEQVLVEGEVFFGGGTELASNGLPARAVGRVDVWHDYNPLGFDLNPNDEKRQVVNVELRESHKQLLFGDVQLAGGTDFRHEAASNVFRYAPKASVYGVVSFNNLNQEVLSAGEARRLLSSGNTLDFRAIQQFARVTGQLTPTRYVREASAGMAGLGYVVKPKHIQKVTGHVLGVRRTNSQPESWSVAISDNDTLVYSEARQILQDKQVDLLLAGLQSKTVLSSGVLTSDFRTSYIVPDLRHQTHITTNRTSSSNTFNDRTPNLDFSGTLAYAKRLRHTGSTQLSLTANLITNDQVSRLISTTAQFPDFQRLTSDSLYVLEQNLRATYANYSIDHSWQRTWPAELNWHIESQVEHTLLERELNPEGFAPIHAQDFLRTRAHSTPAITLSKRRITATAESKLQLARYSYSTEQLPIQTRFDVLPRLKLDFATDLTGSYSLNYQQSLDWNDWHKTSRLPTLLAPTVLYLGSTVSVPTRSQQLGFNYYYRNPISGINVNALIAYNQTVGVRPIFAYGSIAATQRETFETTNAHLTTIRSRLALGFEGAAAKTSIRLTYSATDDVLRIDNRTSPLRNRLFAISYSRRQRFNATVAYNLEQRLAASSYERPLANTNFISSTTHIGLDYSRNLLRCDLELSAEVFDLLLRRRFYGNATTTISYQLKQDGPLSLGIAASVVSANKFASVIQQGALIYNSTNPLFPSYAVLEARYSF